MDGRWRTGRLAGDRLSRLIGRCQGLAIARKSAAATAGGLGRWLGAGQPRGDCQMSSRLTVAILASAVLMQGTAWGQESKPGEDPNQVLPQQIREKLTEQGYKDVKVTPGSFVVSARDQD